MASLQEIVEGQEATRIPIRETSPHGKPYTNPPRWSPRGLSGRACQSMSPFASRRMRCRTRDLAT